MKPTPTALAKKPPVVPTRKTIKGMQVILYGQVDGMSRKDVIAALEELGAKVTTKPVKSADCALVGVEKWSKALEREFLWKRDRVKSYGIKTLMALLPKPAKHGEA